MTTPLRVDGIDLSHYQAGNLDFAQAKRAGVLFVCHKATEGTSWVDNRYAQRRREVATAGLVFGAYHFARPGASSGSSQAERFLKVAAPKPGDLAPMLDLEDRAGMTTARLTAWVTDFVAAVVLRTGVRPIVYTPFGLDNSLWCPLWVARYSNSNTAPAIPDPWKSASVRQFSNGQYGVPNTVAGMGHVDLNTLPGGVGSLASLLIPTGATKPTPSTPTEPSMADPNEIITYSQHTTSGKAFRCSRRTAAHLDSTKAALQVAHPGAELLIAQGCYNTGVAASAGTHDYDAVLDVRIPALNDWWAAQRFLREQGWAAWYRHTGSWSSPSQWHIHMVSLGYRTRVGQFVPGQVADYYAHAQGLKGQHNSGSDGSWHPANIGSTVFNYTSWAAPKPTPPKEEDPLMAFTTADLEAAAQKGAQAALDGLRFEDPDQPGSSISLKYAVRRLLSDGRPNTPEAGK